MGSLPTFSIRRIIEGALEEDIGWRDLTTHLLIEDETQAEGRIEAKEEGVLCGLKVAEQVFQTLQEDVQFLSFLRDGDKFKEGDTLALVRGKAQVLLSGERVALNFLQRLSGIATLTRRFVEKLEGTHTKVLATRKTTPLLRALEKYAVEVGGGCSHRFALYDGILIKNNHITLVGDMREAIRRARKGLPHWRIEVEARNLEEVAIALEEGADIVMLDNMDMEAIREAVKMAKGKALIEVSGGINLENVEEISKLGVDFISVGALTHSAKAIDIHMEVKRI